MISILKDTCRIVFINYY